MNNDLDSLEARIQAAKHRDDPTPQQIQKKTDDANSRAGIQAGMEFVGSIAAGAAIGYGLDHWLDTKPAFFISLFFLGIFTGFFNVYRVTKNLGSAVGYSQLHKQAKDAKTAPELNKNTD